MRALLLSASLLLVTSVAFAAFDECSLQSDIAGPPPSFPNHITLAPGGGLLFGIDGQNVYIYDTLTDPPQLIASVPAITQNYETISAWAADDSALYVGTKTQWPEGGPDSPFGHIYRITPEGTITIVADHLFPVTKIALTRNSMFYIEGGTLRKQAKSGAETQDIALNVTSLFADDSGAFFVVDGTQLYSFSASGETKYEDFYVWIAGRVHLTIEDVAATQADIWIVVETDATKTNPPARNIFRRPRADGWWKEIAFNGGVLNSSTDYAVYAPSYLLVAQDQIFTRIAGHSCDRCPVDGYLATARHDEIFEVDHEILPPQTVMYGDFAAGKCAIYANGILGHYTYALRSFRVLFSARELPATGRLLTIELMGDHGPVESVTIDGLSAPIVSQNESDVTIIAPPHAPGNATLRVDTVDGRNDTSFVVYKKSRARTTRLR